MIRAGLPIAVFAAMLLTAGEVRAFACGVSLSGNYNQINQSTNGPCPLADFAESSWPSQGVPTYVNGSVAADVGSIAVRAFWSGHAYSYYNQMTASATQNEWLNCTLSGPSSPVLTRLAFEAEAALSATRNGFDYGTEANGTEVDGSLAGATASVTVVMGGQWGQSYHTSYVTLTGYDNTEVYDDYECSAAGSFSISGCSGSISFARQKHFTPQISVPTGLFAIWVQGQASGIDRGVNEPVGIGNSASARAEISLPSDGSPVLDLPEGFTLDCENGTVVDNVWQGTPVSLPGPPQAPIPAPALSSAGHYALAAAILGVAIAAIRIRRSA